MTMLCHVHAVSMLIFEEHDVSVRILYDGQCMDTLTRELHVRGWGNERDKYSRNLRMVPKISLLQNVINRYQDY